MTVLLILTTLINETAFKIVFNINLPNISSIKKLKLKTQKLKIK